MTSPSTSSPPLLVGISGKRRRGKDTFAQLLKKDLTRFAQAVRLDDDEVALDRFAAPIKEIICTQLFGLSPSQIEGEEKELIDSYWDLTPRYIMQTVGEGMRQLFGMDFWVKVLFRRLQEREEHVIILTDLRYPQEANAVRMSGGLLVRINRELPYDPEVDRHSSEVSLDDYAGWDFIVDNNYDLKRLALQVGLVAEAVRMKIPYC